MTKVLDQARAAKWANWARIPLHIRLWHWSEEVNGCWLVQRNVHKPSGYVRIGVNGKQVNAHRVMYEAVKGPIPDGLTIDHTCFNTTCVNPKHLEAVTREENSRRAAVRRWAPA